MKKYKSCTVPTGEYCPKHGVVHNRTTNTWEQISIHVEEFLAYMESTKYYFELDLRVRHKDTHKNWTWQSTTSQTGGRK